MRIRVAGADDAQAVLAVWDAARSGGADMADGAEDFVRLIERSPDGVLVAEDDGRVVGTVIAVWDGWRGSIARLVVLPSHRRRGIGRALVDAGEETLRAKGARRVNVLVFEGDEGAGDLWTTGGYVTDPRIVRYWHDL
ncbi:MAG TPA: GNAT family N-acetyltransferase [Thermoleophilaceae bacterium]|nr:GNAT family N-acetyltransferase [Thermoleophilaceae bacterium]